MADTLELVREAIRAKKQIVAVYKGHIRVFCPHAVGYKNGRVQGMFYQCGGESSSGLAPMGSDKNWRCIILAGLTEVSVQDGEWHTCNQHTQSNSCIDTLIEEVDY